MFTNKKSILYITKSKITLIKVTIAEMPKEEIVVELQWTPSTLDDVLLKIKKIVRGKVCPAPFWCGVKILLSEDFVYEALITLPKESQITRETVSQKAQEFIPENLNKTVWSFKEIPAPPLGGQPTKIQITAIVSSLFQQIEKAIAKAEIQADTIEPLSYAFSRFTKGFEKPFLFVYIEDKTYLILAQKEVVLATERLESPSINAINQLVAFAKDTINVDIKDVIFCGKTQNINLSSYQNASFRVEVQDISPAISLAGKEAFQEGPSMLSLQLLKVIQKEKETATQTQKTTIPKNHFSYLIAVAIGFIVTIVTAVGFTKNLQDTTKHDTLLTPTTATPTVPLSSSPLNRLDYTIIVLNASGKGGVATKTKELLTDNGFNVVRLGNAENPNFEKTEVRFKETVPNALILLLDKVLKSLYDFSIGTKLEETSESDILIIIGKS